MTNNTAQIRSWPSGLVILLLFAFSHALMAQNPIPFNRDNWNFQGGQALEHQGQSAYMGRAELAGVNFTNGTIEVDVFVTGQRSFPGIFWRKQENGDAELFYIRPHKLDGLHYDALQYTPVFHNVSCWQLYHGTGYTQAVRMPVGEWVHLKLQVSGSQAQLFINENPNPALVIYQLEHPTQSGKIGISGPPDGSAYFSNFIYSEADPNLEANPSAPGTPGIVKVWEISNAIPNNLVDPYALPEDNLLKDLEWIRVLAAPNGLVNLTKELVRNPTQAGWTLAKTSLFRSEPGSQRFALGYSDFVSVFLNGQLVFTGNSAFRSRDPGFSGVIGYNDEITLNLKQGENELTLMVGEQMGGWGFMLCEADAIWSAPGLSMEWEIAHQLDHPESAEYDPIRQVIYVSNNLKRPTESISKLSIDGQIIDREWAKGLRAPTGLFLAGRTLYAVERGGVVLIETLTGNIIKRIPLPGAIFPNDICGDAKRKIFYISDSGGNAIFKIENDSASVWMKGQGLIQPNGLQLKGDALLVGCNGYPALMEIDLQTQSMKTLCKLYPGAVIDGIQVRNKGDILFSDWNGSLYNLDQTGQLTELLNTRVPGINLADFKWIESKSMLIIPSLYDNRVMLWRYRKPTGPTRL